MKLLSKLALCSTAILTIAPIASCTSKTQDTISLKTLSIKTHCKLEYKVGEKFDLSGLCLLATYSDDTTKEISGGYYSSLPQGYEFTEEDANDSLEVQIIFEGKLITLNINVKPDIEIITKDEWLKRYEPIYQNGFLADYSDPSKQYKFSDLSIEFNYKDGTQESHSVKNFSYFNDEQYGKIARIHFDDGEFDWWTVAGGYISPQNIKNNFKSETMIWSQQGSQFVFYDHEQDDWLVKINKRGYTDEYSYYENENSYCNFKIIYPDV